MSKKFTENLNSIQNQIASIKAFVGSGKPVAFRDYMVMRETLNIAIIQVVFGCTIKGANKVSFDKPLPNMSELAKLHRLMVDFHESVEVPFIDSCNLQLEQDVSSNVMPIELGANIPTFDKIKKKVVVDSMIGSGANSIMHALFTPDQLLEMSALAEQLRAKIRKDQILIIAGITLAVTATAVGGYCVYRHNHKKDDVTDDAADYDDNPSIEDIPHVDLDDDLS